MDLAEAHIKALHYLENNERIVCNLGAGRGYSVKEVLIEIEKDLGPIKVAVKARRSGDPAEVFADNTKAKEVLGWEPRNSELENIIKTAVVWHKNAL
jgi:UDP-glucose 4-epimerase